ncbi:hypothetical protein JCM10212_000228 [Sporobolomyces blumeae]
MASPSSGVRIVWLVALSLLLSPALANPSSSSLPTLFAPVHGPNRLGGGRPGRRRVASSSGRHSHLRRGFFSDVFGGGGGTATSDLGHDATGPAGATTAPARSTTGGGGVPATPSSGAGMPADPSPSGSTTTAIVGGAIGSIPTLVTAPGRGTGATGVTFNGETGSVTPSTGETGATSVSTISSGLGTASSAVVVTVTSIWTNPDGSRSTMLSASSRAIPLASENDVEGGKDDDGAGPSGKTWGIIGGVVGGIAVLLGAVVVLYRCTQRRFTNLDDLSSSRLSYGFGTTHGYSHSLSTTTDRQRGSSTHFVRDKDEIKWPELEPAGQTVSKGFGTLNPSRTRRTGRAGVEMEGDLDDDGRHDLETTEGIGHEMRSASQRDWLSEAGYFDRQDSRLDLVGRRSSFDPFVDPSTRSSIAFPHPPTLSHVLAYPPSSGPPNPSPYGSPYRDSTHSLDPSVREDMASTTAGGGGRVQSSGTFITTTATYGGMTVPTVLISSPCSSHRSTMM